MKLLFISLFILFSSSALSQIEKNSDDNFINLTNEIKDDEKLSKKVENDKETDKKSDNETKKIETVTIGKLEIPSLGSIGVETNLNKKKGLNLWSNFTASNAIKYLNLLPNKISSRSYQRFLNEVYASTSEPPKGNTDEISKFLETRLVKLAFNAQTDYLIKIISQLPDSPKWERWKKWYVIHHFLVKDDINACLKISNTINNYDSTFWKKANLLCLILQRNLSEANFIYDVMRSQNLLDETYETLIDKILNEKQLEKFNFKDKSVTPLNLILLDITKYPISFEMIKDFGFEIDEQIEINSHYRGYLKKQNADILAFKRDENLVIPENINYDQFSGLSNEVKAKFKEIRPKTMGQALRIDGITPAAVYILLSHVKRKSIKHIA